MVGSGAEISTTHKRAIRKWAFVFDRAYQADGSAFSGWISSYSGDPIPLPDMEAWLDATIDRILATRPTAIFEIGCGTGLIARRVIPEVARYGGVDISAAAIEQLSAQIGEAPGTTLLCGAAHEVASLFEPGFDLVVINSVIQYFTDLDYLDGVLADAIALLRPGGSLFVGDVRNADLADAFFASVALAQAPDASPEELRAKAAGLSEINGELQVSPGYFDGLTARFPRISDVRMLLKPGAFDNELTNFRYDVIITLDGAPAELDADVARWSDLGAFLPNLETRLGASPGRALRVTDIPNARLRASLAAERQLRAIPPSEREEPGLYPHSFEELAQRLGFDIAIAWNATDPGRFDALFMPAR